MSEQPDTAADLAREVAAALPELTLWADYIAHTLLASGLIVPRESEEWGIRHSQGLRKEDSERMARAYLPGMVKRHEENYRDTVRPVLMRRYVSAWEVVPDE